MAIRYFASSRFFILIFAFLLLLSVAASDTRAAGDGCPGAPNTPQDLEIELERYFNNQPLRCDSWYYTNDPAFESWDGGSLNLSVVSTAVGLYREGPNVNVKWYVNPKHPSKNPNPTGYLITYANWWIWYLASQIGQDPTTYLPAPFVPPPDRPHLKYFKGTEQFSNIYDAPVVTSVVAVRYWAYLNKNNPSVIDPVKVNQLIELTQRYLHANWAIYGMSAGAGPVWTYDLGMRQTPSGPVPTRTPVLPPTKPKDNTQYNPAAPRSGAGYIYTGHFLALAGARSKLGGHWNYDYKFQLFDRAIEQFGVLAIATNKLPAEYRLLKLLQDRWTTLPSRPNENVYGLTSDDRANFDTLLKNGADGRTGCASGSNFPSCFQTWVKNRFQPWLAGIRTSTTYRIFGWSGWRASMMAVNTNGNTTNMYAIAYQADDPNDPDQTHAKATFLYPWNDGNGAGATGECTLANGLITAKHGDVFNKKGRLTHPAMEVFMSVPTEQPLFQLGLTSGSEAVFDSTEPKSLINGYTAEDTAFGGDRAWVSNSVPADGVTAGDGEDWNWIESNPDPHSEANRVHQSNIVAGLHQHYFLWASDTLYIEPSDTLYAYAYLDPANPPSEVMLQWLDSNDGWEHRAYWGADQIGWGTNGTVSRRYMGPLPQILGDWVRLEVPASLVGLEGHTLTGMAFTLYGGRATWDEAGTSLSPPQASATTNVAAGKAAIQSSTAFSGIASRAVDGNTDGNWNSNSLTHTNNDYQAWWQVDLGATYTLDQIKIWNRTDCCSDRLSNFFVFVSDDPFMSTDPWSTRYQWGVSTFYTAGQAGTTTVLSAGNRTGRYVRVQLADANYLSLAEVQVFGVPAN